MLGPLVFLILIGDIDKEVNTSFLQSFAGDTHIGRAVKCENDAKELQADLNSVYTWCQENNMSFNRDKFESMSYAQKKTKSPNDRPNYMDNNGDIIDRSEHVKDIGVNMSADGTFSYHINSVVSKAKHMCSWILRTFKTRECIPMLTLYKSMVITHRYVPMHDNLCMNHRGIPPF